MCGYMDGANSCRGCQWSYCPTAYDPGCMRDGDDGDDLEKVEAHRRRLYEVGVHGPISYEDAIRETLKRIEADQKRYKKLKSECKEFHEKAWLKQIIVTPKIYHERVAYWLEQLEKLKKKPCAGMKD